MEYFLKNIDRFQEPDERDEELTNEIHESALYLKHIIQTSAGQLSGRSEFEKEELIKYEYAKFVKLLNDNEVAQEFVKAKAQEVNYSIDGLFE